MQHYIYYETANIQYSKTYTHAHTYSKLLIAKETSTALLSLPILLPHKKAIRMPF